MLKFDALANFVLWYLDQPFMGLQSYDVYDYGKIRSLVIYRDAPFQVELFTGVEGWAFPDPHRHPNVDTYECLVSGFIPFIVNGKPFEAFPVVKPHGTFHLTHVGPNDWHGADPAPGTASFLSIQMWLKGVQPTSVGLDWEGNFSSEEHVNLVKNLSPNTRTEGSC